MTGRLRPLGAVLLVVGMVAMQATPAHAGGPKTITVNDCSSEKSTGAGDIGIADAVATANGDTGDTINFSCTGTVATSSTLHVTGIMTIDGSGQTVVLDGGNAVRLFFVGSGASLGLSHLTLHHGHASFGGAIYNLGTVSITSSALARNSATSGSGGAILNAGGTTTIASSTLAGNSATFGGAISTFGGTVTIIRSTLSGNSASTNGGAVYNGGAVSVTSSTLSGNTAFEGGAIYNFGTMTVTSSTLAGNSASYNGGAIFNEGTVTTGASIVASKTGGNYTGGNCVNVSPATMTDTGYNLEWSGAGQTDTCGFGGSGKHDLTGINPRLGSLAQNGGPTAGNGGPMQTRALQSGSPAIDHIPLGTLGCAAGGSDQRGAARPDGTETSCDIGAYEYQDQTRIRRPRPPRSAAITPPRW